MQWSWILGRQVREGEEDAADDVPESPSKGDNGLKGGTTTVTSADSAATETGSSGGEKDTTESGTTKQKNVIDFDPSNVPSADPVIRPITGVTDSQTFRWRPDNGSVSVDRIMWRGRTSEDESFKNIATSKKPSTGDYPDDGPLSDGENPLARRTISQQLGKYVLTQPALQLLERAPAWLSRTSSMTMASLQITARMTWFSR